jgi:hypothetical protein
VTRVSIEDTQVASSRCSRGPATCSSSAGWRRSTASSRSRPASSTTSSSSCAAAARSGKDDGVYVTINPVNPALLARAPKNKVRRAGSGDTTSDRDVATAGRSSSTSTRFAQPASRRPTRSTTRDRDGATRSAASSSSAAGRPRSSPTAATVRTWSTRSICPSTTVGSCARARAALEGLLDADAEGRREGLQPGAHLEDLRDAHAQGRGHGGATAPGRAHPRGARRARRSRALRPRCVRTGRETSLPVQRRDHRASTYTSERARRSTSIRGSPTHLPDAKERALGERPQVDPAGSARSTTATIAARRTSSSITSGGDVGGLPSRVVQVGLEGSPRLEVRARLR